MKWNKFQLKTTTEAEDLVGEMLSSLSVEGIEIEDNVPLSEEDKRKMFIDILPEMNTEDHTAIIRFYMDMNTDVKAFTEKVKEGLANLSEFIDVGSGELKVSETEDKDWINNWKEFFKPFRVDDTIVIKPTWESLPEQKDTDLVIEIDPGTAFGTGAHETTKLCILNLKKYLKAQDRVLDIGCGSGILSILSKKLSAGIVTAVDIDCIATEVTLENAEVNGLKGELKVITGDVLLEEPLREELSREGYNIVVANILADVIIPLSSLVTRFMKEGALFISSGIINTKREAVEKAILENRMSIVEVLTMGDWVSIVARKDV